MTDSVWQDVLLRYAILFSLKLLADGHTPQSDLTQAIVEGLFRHGIDAENVMSAIDAIALRYASGGEKGSVTDDLSDYLSHSNWSVKSRRQKGNYILVDFEVYNPGGTEYPTILFDRDGKRLASELAALKRWNDVSDG